MSEENLCAAACFVRMELRHAPFAEPAAFLYLCFPLRSYSAHESKALQLIQKCGGQKHGMENGTGTP
ncbi:MAG: hypothetical protein PUD16_08215 [bacterium]|nr:hypothetical protein [bacterium]